MNIIDFFIYEKGDFYNFVEVASDTAKKLGYSAIVILISNKKIKKIGDYLHISNTKLPVYFGVLFENEPIQKIRSLAADLFYSKTYIDLILIKGQDYKYNKNIADIHYINGIYNPGFSKQFKDHLHYRFTGISSKVINKLKKERLYPLYFSLLDIIEGNIDQKILFIGRLLYLSKFLNKWRIPLVLGTFSKNPYFLLHPKILISFKYFFKLKHCTKDIFYNYTITQIRRTRAGKNPDIFAKNYQIVLHPYQDCREF